MEDAPVDALLRPNIQGQTPLHLAAEMDDPSFLEELLIKMKLGNKGESKKIEKRDQKPKEGDPSGDFEQVEEAEELEGGMDMANDKQDKNQKNEQDAEQEDEIEGSMDTYKAEQENATKSNKIICKDSRGRSPIFNACEKKNLSPLKLLL